MTVNDDSKRDCHVIPGHVRCGRWTHGRMSCSNALIAPRRDMPASIMAIPDDPYGHTCWQAP